MPPDMIRSLVYLVALSLIACGGNVEVIDDAGDAAIDSPLVTEASTDTSADASVTDGDGSSGPTCFVDGVGYDCAAKWSCSDAAIACDVPACSSGAACWLPDGAVGTVQ